MWTHPHNMIKGIDVGGDEAALLALPYGVEAVTRGSTLDLDRLKTEVALIWTPNCRKDPNYPWGRESFFRSRSGGTWCSGRRLLRYSVNSAGRIVRGWYLTRADCERESPYRFEAGCPLEAAWLESIAVGKPSEPAWLYLKPKLYQIEIDQDGEWITLWTNKSWSTYQEAWEYAKTKATELAKAAQRDVYLRVSPDPDNIAMAACMATAREPEGQAD